MCLPNAFHGWICVLCVRVCACVRVLCVYSCMLSLSLSFSLVCVCVCVCVYVCVSACNT